MERIIVDSENIDSLFEICESQILLTMKHGSKSQKKDLDYFLTGLNNFCVNGSYITVKNKLLFVKLYLAFIDGANNREIVYLMFGD